MILKIPNNKTIAFSLRVSKSKEIILTTS